MDQFRSKARRESFQCFTVRGPAFLQIRSQMLPRFDDMVALFVNLSLIMSADNQLLQFMTMDNQFPKLPDSMIVRHSGRSVPPLNCLTDSVCNCFQS